MSYSTHDVVEVWYGGCLMWWMSGVVDVWCGGCHILPMVWWMSSVVDVWCGECPFLALVWWMSGVVDVCVVDVVQSKMSLDEAKVIVNTQKKLFHFFCQKCAI